MSLENCKLKQLSNIPLEWQRCQTVTTSHTDGNVEQKKLSSIAGGMQIGTATLAVSYKTNHNFTMKSSNCTPWYLSKYIYKLCPHSLRNPTHGCLWQPYL